MSASSRKETLQRGWSANWLPVQQLESPRDNEQRGSNRSEWFWEIAIYTLRMVLGTGSLCSFMLSNEPDVTARFMILYTSGFRIASYSLMDLICTSVIFIVCMVRTISRSLISNLCKMNLYFRDFYCLKWTRTFLNSIELALHLSFPISYFLANKCEFVFIYDIFNRIFLNIHH